MVFIFTDDIFKSFLLNDDIWISTKISLTFFPKSSINSRVALIQIMTWRRTGDKQLFERMMTWCIDAYA